MIDAVAHCAVAILTIPSIEGSASATAAGVIAEFNIACMGAFTIGNETAKCIVDEWLNAKFEGGRHATRVDMIMDVEKRNHNL